MATIRYREVTKEDGTYNIEEIHKVVVHSFLIGDVEDPDIYASEPLWQWDQSPQGQFVIKHAVNNPEWQRHVDPMNFGYKYTIIAELEKKKLAEYYLRWGKPGWK